MMSKDDDKESSNKEGTTSDFWKLKLLGGGISQTEEDTSPAKCER